MRLRIVRHAHCSYDYGIDPPLSPKGRQQAISLGQRLAKDSPTQIFTSPKIRCLETASAVAVATGVRPKVWTELAENGLLYGQPGICRSDLTNSFPLIDVPQDFSEDGWGRGRLEGKGQADDALALKRAKHVVDRLTSKTKDVDICLMTHAAFANMLLRVLLKIESDQTWFSIDNTSVTTLRLSFETGLWVRVVHVNSIDHLSNSESGRH